MVLLEIATLITAGIGLADYYHTKVYRSNLRLLKSKYGEHPNIEEAFKDICTLGGEHFEMPKLVLDEKYPHINMGSYYTPEAQGPVTVLNEFFVTPSERVQFHDLYAEEAERQRKLRNKELSKMYKKILPVYRSGELNTMGSTKMTNRRFKTPIMLGFNHVIYADILNDIRNHTIWGELVETEPNIHGGGCKFGSEWYISEDAFNRIRNEEVYRLLFECCYYGSKIRYV